MDNSVKEKVRSRLLPYDRRARRRIAPGHKKTGEALWLMGVAGSKEEERPAQFPAAGRLLNWKTVVWILWAEGKTVVCPGFFADSLSEFLSAPCSILVLPVPANPYCICQDGSGTALADAESTKRFRTFELTARASQRGPDSRARLLESVEPQPVPGFVEAANRGLR
jgi:hypothetical protein